MITEDTALLVDNDDVPLKLLKRIREGSGTLRLIEEQLRANKSSTK